LGERLQLNGYFAWERYRQLCNGHFQASPVVAAVALMLNVLTTATASLAALQPQAVGAVSHLIAMQYKDLISVRRVLFPTFRALLIPLACRNRRICRHL